ncbi:MAG: SPOR domain-containing protein [Rickettsiales bacterium]
MANEYDAEDDKNLENLEGPGLRWMSIIVVILVVVGFFSLAWYAYHTSKQPLSTDETNTITAGDEPYKEKPQAPGGMEIDHQDATVYDMISENGDKKEDKVEQLLPEAEEPVVTRDTTKPEPKEVTDYMKEKKSAQMAQPETPKTEEAPKVEAKTEEKPVTSPAPSKTVEAPKTVKPAPIVAKTVTKPASAKPVAPAAITPSAGGSAQVQIGALKSQAEAETAWKNFSSKYGDLLKGKSHAVVKADLGAKGVFYRLRVTGLASKGDASKLCSALQGRGASCMLVN